MKATILDRIATDRLRGLHQPVEAYERIFRGFEHVAAAAFQDLAGDPEQEPPDAHQPRQIAGYRVVRELGHGGQGSVYLAEDETLGRLVAIKILSPLHAGDADRLERFRREAALVSRLEDPGICRLYNTGTEGSRPYFVMEYVRGSSLAEIAANGNALDTFGLHTVLGWFAQVARSLHRAHDAGVVHRDVKPANLLLDHEGRVVLLDFGLACSMSEDWTSITMSDAAIGTPAYMSPEQLRSHAGSLDARTDIYSLAVTLYELLTGTRPFRGATREELTAAIKLGRSRQLRQIAPDLSRGLERIVAKAMEREPTRRYPSAQALADDLERARKSQPVHARSLPTLIRGGRFLRDHPVATTLLASLAAALVISLALLDIADRRLTENQQLIADKKLQSLLQADNPDLWRVHPDTLQLKRDWLNAASDLQANLDSYRASLAKLRAEGQRVDASNEPANPSGRAGQIRAELALRASGDADHRRLQQLEQQLDATTQTTARTQWSFDNSSEQWRHDQLASLVATLEGINDPAAGILTPRLVTRQLERTLRVERATIEQHTDSWHAFTTAINQAPGFTTIDPTPQVGLVPLGPDPTSGYYEFALAASGSPPTRHADTGELQLTPGSAAIIVLLPGGEFPAGEDTTARRVTLSPFLIGKHEITQAQWVRVMGTNNSVYQQGHKKVDITPLHPVENVTWFDARKFARRLDMTLPSEAQWEYACLAGNGGRYAWDGDATVALLGRANVADQSLKASDLPHANWNDTFPVTAPIASFVTNTFGLHDMHGNVCEWCSDQYEPQSQLTQLMVAGDGKSVTATDPRRVFKGGSWYLRPQQAHARIRHRLPANQSNSNLGVRVARLWPTSR